MRRKTIPRAIKDIVLKEFNHRCAICGTHNPHIHHIDEDPENNDPQNLLPLCPNCHLLDQHDPTGTIDQRKLSLFRQYKDPLILSTQFQPLFRRLKFLLELDPNEFDLNKVSASAAELVGFVKQLEMGSFYGPEIEKYVKEPVKPRIWTTDTPDSFFRQADEEDRQEYLKILTGCREVVINLIIELLRYQQWQAPQKRNTS